MFTDVDNRIKKNNKILFSRDSESLKKLSALICGQDRLTLVLWAFDCLQIPISEFMTKYPDEIAIKAAYDLCLAWSHGEVKMPIAKKSILECHAVAKRLNNDYDIAICHAIGQGCSSIHVKTHTLGLIFYELTAIVIKCDYTHYQDKILEKIDFYTKRLEWWRENVSEYASNQKWAVFLIKPSNK